MGKKKDLCRPSVVFCGIFMVLEGKRDPARVPGTFSGIYFGNICFWDIFSIIETCAGHRESFVGY